MIDQQAASEQSPSCWYDPARFTEIRRKDKMITFGNKNGIAPQKSKRHNIGTLCIDSVCEYQRSPK